MTQIVVDVEFDGRPCPTYSMVSFAAIVLDRKLDKTFFGQVAPISNRYNNHNLGIIGITREEHLSYPKPEITMHNFKLWLEIVSGGKDWITMWSDNPAVDFPWLDYYMLTYGGGVNPLGHSGRRIGDLYCGLVKDFRKNPEWKKRLRKTAHTHHPLDDARGNAEALLAIADMGVFLGKDLRPC